MMRIIIAVSLLCCSFLCFSQIENYKIYSISSEDGLLSDNVECIFQDSYGFLWVGNSDGLVRWDGHAFKKYTHIEGDATTISNNIIYCVFEDSRKRLWVGTINGLNVYDPERDIFSKVTINAHFENIPVNVIKEDAQHRLWLATSDGLCHYDHDTGKTRWYYADPDQPEGLSDGVIFSMDIDKEDNVWLGTFNGGLNKYNTKTGRFSRFMHQPGNTQSICSNKIKKLLVDREGNVWAGSIDNGISLLNGEGKLIRHYQLRDNKGVQHMISCIYQDKHQRIWVGLGDQPLFFLDKTKDTFVSFLNPVYKKYHASCYGITAMYEDSFGNTWFGSERNGLYYSNDAKNIFKHYFYNYASSEGLSHDVVTVFCEDKNKNIWIGTNGGGLDFFDTKKNKFYSYTTKAGLNSLAVQDVKQDKSGKLWIATRSGGVSCYDPVKGSCQSFLYDPLNPYSIVYNDVTSLVIDDSLVWMGTYGEGVCVYNLLSKKFIHHKNNKSFAFNMLAPAWTNHLFKDSKGRLWIGAYGGLYRYEKNKLFSYKHSADISSISDHDINMIAEDAKGNIWIVTVSGGLELFDEQNNSFIHYSQLYNLPLNIKSIATDDKGLLWLGSNSGIVCFDPVKKEYISYGMSDGLQGDFFFLKSALRSSKGELFFGGSNGFNVFHPENIKQDFNAARFYFTDLSVFGVTQKPGNPETALSKTLMFSDTLRISYHQSFFTIGFADINFYAPAKTKYAYKLEGLYDRWIYNGMERKTSFTNLPAGKYVLKIKYTLPNGKWQEASSSLLILVSPPWWKTWWFRAVLVLLLLALVYVFYQFRLRSIKKRNEQLSLEVKNRTQELSEKNSDLMERNEEIKLQKEKLEEYNEEIVRQSDKILKQQEHILSQNEALEETVQKLSLSDKTKNLFFNILAHDLKGPIAGISGLADLLVNNIDKLNQKEIIEFSQHIQNSSNVTHQLLINLLDWARTQSDMIQYTPDSFNLSDLLRKTILLLEQQCLKKGIRIINEVNLDHTLFVDYKMIDTVFRNLISNSIKFTPKGGEVVISSESHDEEIIVRISDNGVGMSTEQLEHIFRIDKRTYSKGTQGEIGTGLGLILTKDFVDLNKGTIRVESELNRGTVFVLSFPKSNRVLPSGYTVEEVQFSHVEKEKPSPAWEKDAIAKIKGKRILIVDDNIELRHHLRWILSGTFEIFEAENGKEGIAVASEIQPTVIITDMVMPVMDGIEFCREIKHNRNTCHIPVIILTSQDTEESQLSGYYAGADIYITKPARQEILFQIILNILQTQENISKKLAASDQFFSENIPLQNLDAEFIQKALSYIEEHLADQDLDAERIGKHLALSRSVLYAKFKTITGQGVNEFIRTVRLKKSKELLKTTSLSVNEVAYEVGFNSASYYIRCFVKEFGLTPKEYRQGIFIKK